MSSCGRRTCFLGGEDYMVIEDVFLLEKNMELWENPPAPPLDCRLLGRGIVGYQHAIFPVVVTIFIVPKKGPVFPEWSFFYFFKKISNQFYDF